MNKKEQETGVLDDLRKEFSQPVPIRTPLLFAITVVVIGLLIGTVVLFEPTAEAFGFLFIYLSISLILSRAVYKRLRRRDRAPRN